KPTHSKNATRCESLLNSLLGVLFSRLATQIVLAKNKNTAKNFNWRCCVKELSTTPFTPQAMKSLLKLYC
ncbi:TPA: hypothetical protein ACGSTK_004479, partial [Vibrio parahaemolyticus]